MRHVRRLHRYTYGDYVALELQSPTKHEFLDGASTRWRAAPRTIRRSPRRCCGYSAMPSAIDPARAHVRFADLRGRPGLATFPDGTVICGPLVQHPPSLQATALNPMMLVEVTSDSSEEYDTVDKLHCYRTIPTLHDYIIVSHRERRLTLHRRTSIDTWATHVAIAGGRVVGSSLNAELVVDEMYRGSRIA